jgi:hypothetical protein
MSDIIPDEIKLLFDNRQKCRNVGRYNESDETRDKLSKLGYEIIDSPSGSKIIKSKKETSKINLKPGLIAIFGSGEVSSTGRKVHEYLIKQFTQSIDIALLETSTGYEDNPHIWYQKMANFLINGLKNYHPMVTRIEALTNSDNGGTNDKLFIQSIDRANYIHSGAGSPTYALRHLSRSLVWKRIINRVDSGVSVSFASAMAIASSRYCLPVYEIYFAGHDPSWLEGLDFLGKWGLNITLIPHWNNTEGGNDIDTRYSYMGKKRFSKLLKLLPGPTTIIGIDEHTSVIFDISKQSALVMGKGSVHLYGENILSYMNNEEIPFAQITSMCYFPK